MKAKYPEAWKAESGGRVIGEMAASHLLSCGVGSAVNSSTGVRAEPRPPSVFLHFIAARSCQMAFPSISSIALWINLYADAKNFQHFGGRGWTCNTALHLAAWDGDTVAARCRSVMMGDGHEWDDRWQWSFQLLQSFANWPKVTMSL